MKEIRGLESIKLWFTPKVLIEEIEENRIRIRKLERTECEQKQ